MKLANRPLIRFTDKAREMLLAFLGAESEQVFDVVRVAVRSGSPLDPRFSVCLVDSAQLGPEDYVFEAGGFRVAVDPDSATVLEGGQVDWLDGAAGKGFEVRAPRMTPNGSATLEGPLAERVRVVLEREVNPLVAAHGGAIRLVGVRQNTVYVRMAGGCQGCGIATITLRQGVERMLKQAIPEIESVVDVTDHGAGLNPYYV